MARKTRLSLGNAASKCLFVLMRRSKSALPQRLKVSEGLRLNVEQNFFYVRGKALSLVLLMAALMAACSPFAILYPSDATDHRFTVSRASLICGTSLDRAPLRPGVGGVTLLSDPELGPVAGFSTQFTPGQPPSACDRLSTTVKQGAVKFDVQSRLALEGRRLTSAWLDVTGFFPEGEISVVGGESWDREFGVGELIDTRVRRECEFSIRLSDAPWPPPRAGNGLPNHRLVDYSTDEQARFIVPIGRSSPRFLVTPTVQAWLAGERELGFVIEPTDPAMGMKSDSRCSGLFHVRLRIYAR